MPPEPKKRRQAQSKVETQELVGDNVKSRRAGGGKRPTKAVELVGSRVRVSLDWLLEDPKAQASIASGAVLAPTKTPTILRAFKAVYTWFKERDIQRAAEEIRWMIPASTRRGEVVDLPLQPDVLALFGLPPGARVRWYRRGGEALLLFAHPLLPAAAKRRRTFKLTPTLLEQAATELERWTGMPLEPSARQAFVTTPRETKTGRFHQAFGVFVSRAWLERLVGEEQWKSFTEGAGADVPGIGVEISGGSGFAPEVSESDRAYFHHWMGQAGSVRKMRQSGWRIPIGNGFIAELRRLDENEELKQKVIARLRSNPAALQSPNVVQLRSLIRRVEIAEKRAEFGLKGRRPPSMGPAKHRVPVRGAILNRGGLVYVGKTVDLEFELHSRISEVAVPDVNVYWVIHKKGDERDQRQAKRMTYPARIGPKAWSVRFPKPGIYVVHAIVNHHMFEENYFSTEIEVKTKNERQGELNQQAFGHMGATRTMKHNFDTSWTNEEFGDRDQDKGNAYRSVLPKDFEASGFPDFLSFVDAEAERMDQVIKLYEGRDPALLKMAKSYRSRLDDMRADVGKDEEQGFVSFEVNGAFLSSKNRVPDKPLRLLGVAKRRKPDNGDAEIEVKVHDTSFVTEQVKYEYSANSATFMGALEKVFVKLCKSYPSGRVSLMAQQLDDSLLPTGAGRGFELETGTAWKDLKAVVWDPAVQVAVNIAASAAMVFIPGSMMVALPLLIGYNATDTLDNIANLKARGVLKTGDVVQAGVLIGLDLIPFLGRLKVVQRIGDTALWGLEAIEVGAQGLVLTHQGIEALENLRDNEIATVGKLVAERNAVSAELRRRKSANPSDPQIQKLENRLAKLETDVRDAIFEARSAANSTFSKMAESYSTLMVGVAATKTIADKLPPTPKRRPPGGSDEGGGGDRIDKSGRPSRNTTATTIDETGQLADPRIRKALEAQLGVDIVVDPSLGRSIVVRKPDTKPTRVVLRVGPEATAKQVLDKARMVRSRAVKNEDTTSSSPTSDGPAKGKTKRVDEPVEGLYESIDPDSDPPGWEFDDKVTPIGGGIIEIHTDITAPNGATGWMKRQLDTQTNTLVMKAAFFKPDLPRWISAGKPLSNERGGTPTFAFTQLRQMRKLGVGRSKLDQVQMSTIVNERTILELAASRKAKEPLETAILKTHSVKYAETALIQSGHRIRSAKVTGGFEDTIESLLGNLPSETLQKYGLKPDDLALVYFDIELDIVPWK